MGYHIDEHIPGDLSGNVVVITGADSGIGFETARKLSSKGATIVFACRNPGSAISAMEKIERNQPEADLIYVELDLSRQSSIEAFVKRYKEEFDKIDVLLNNAEVKKGPIGSKGRATTEDGFEWVAGVNHYGTYALTIRLLNEGLFEMSDAPRIVVATRREYSERMSSCFDLNDIDIKERKYSPSLAYGQSKAMNALFACKLERILRKNGLKAGKHVKVILADTGLIRMATVGVYFEIQARVHLVAAVSEDVESGTCLRATRRLLRHGPPVPIQPEEYYDEELQDVLWKITEKRTGLTLNL